ncbi:thiamine pyrophosphokinase [Blastocladiella britannica]|nr:thiamine pyrophosphokinase [Blastocladiella britannica]
MTLPSPSTTPPPRPVAIFSAEPMSVSSPKATSSSTAADYAHGLHHYLRPAASGQRRFALVIVNRPLDAIPAGVLQDLWLNAEWRLCADGGANRLHDRLASTPALQNRLVPHVIAGDMDSARPEVVAFYRRLGARVQHSSCQNTTDLQKCVAVVDSIERRRSWGGSGTVRSQATSPSMSTASSMSSLASATGGNADPTSLVDLQHQLEMSTTPLDLLILGGSDGRFDQVIGIVHTLHAMAAANPARRVTVLDGANALTVLPPGTHSIGVMAPLEGPHCGLLPLDGPATVSTRGLVWNCDALPLAMASFVSACNQVDRAHLKPRVPKKWAAMVAGSPPSASSSAPDLTRSDSSSSSTGPTDVARALGAPVGGVGVGGGVSGGSEPASPIPIKLSPVPLHASLLSRQLTESPLPPPVDAVLPPIAVTYHPAPALPEMVAAAAAAAAAATASAGTSPMSASAMPLPESPSDCASFVAAEGAPDAPSLRKGERVSTVLVATNRPVVWSIAMDFGSMVAE